MIYKVGILGASGRMGLEIAGLLEGGFSIGGDRLELADAIAGSSRLKSIDGVDVRTLDEKGREPLHVWIDFSRPKATLQFLSQLETPIVIGTTGFTEEEVARIGTFAERHPVLLASNTSPGMNQFFRILRDLPDGAFSGWSVALRDEHHIKKLDAPGGTAKTLLALLKQKGFEKVDVQVTRAGGIRGNHSVRFITDEEEFELVHRVMDRRVFARGALQAAHFLARQRTPRVYSMEEVEG